MQLLIDDMGGFGRAIEVLYAVMVDMRKALTLLEFVPVLRRIVDTIRETFPGIVNILKDMREAFLSVISQRSIDYYSKARSFGNSTVDDVISSGLMRKIIVNYCDYLECPYVLYLLLDSEAHPWEALSKYAPRQQRADLKPCRLWGELNCKVRVLKSMALSQYDSVELSMLHQGARFGARASWSVLEMPHKYGIRPEEMKAKTVKLNACACDRASGSSVFYYARRNGLPSFVCQRSCFDESFQEIHHCKVVQGELSEEKFRLEREKWAGVDDLHALLHWRCAFRRVQSHEMRCSRP